MFSIADMAVAGAVALLLFGPDQLPKVARRAGQLVRDVQNTSQSFIREIERAADDHERHDGPVEIPVASSVLSSAPVYHETPEPASHERVAMEAALGSQPGAAETERSFVVGADLGAPAVAESTADAGPSASRAAGAGASASAAELHLRADGADVVRLDEARSAPGQPAP